MTLLPFEDLPPSQRFDIECGITEFYTDYPRKVGPRKMAEAYRKAIKRGVLHCDIMSGLARYIANKPAYADWMYPATFLNGDHCYNEYGTAPVASKPLTHAELEIIAAHVRKPWCERGAYPRDVLEQCRAAGFLTAEEVEDKA